MAESPKKLAVVGTSVRAATFSALRAGYEVVAADLFADADLQRTAPVTRIHDYPFGLIEWLERSDCDAWLYTGALENHPDQIALMGALQPLLGNDGEALRRVRDPLELQRVAAREGLSFPDTRSLAEGLPHDGSWLCKTYRGASGSGVWALEGEASLQRAGRERADFQQRVAGVSAAAVFACGEHDATLLGVTQQLVGELGAHPWQYAGSIGPMACSPAIHVQLTAIGEMLAKQFQLRGLAGVDCVIAGDRVWIVEINPRYTASMEVLDRATGVSAIAAHVAACGSGEGDVDGMRVEITSLPKPPLIHGKCILFAPRDARVSTEFHQWAMEHSCLEGATLADIPRAGEAIPADRPVLTAFAAGETADECRGKLAERLAEVEARLYHG